MNVVGLPKDIHDAGTPPGRKAVKGNGFGVLFLHEGLAAKGGAEQPFLRLSDSSTPTV